MNPEVIQVVSDARQLLIHPESWINCFALGIDADADPHTGDEVWDVSELEEHNCKLSLMGALELAAHRRKYPKAIMDAVVKFLYPLAWRQISVPYPFPHQLYDDLREGGHFMYEEFGYYNDEDSRTHAEVIGVLNMALGYGYARVIPSLPMPNDAAKHSFEELSAENRESVKQQLCELVDDESQEFGKALVDHFPPEDGMPFTGDVEDFMASWCDWGLDDYDDHTVERAMRIMELIYHETE